MRHGCIRLGTHASCHAAWHEDWKCWQTRIYRLILFMSWLSQAQPTTTEKIFSHKVTSRKFLIFNSLLIDETHLSKHYCRDVIWVEAPNRRPILRLAVCRKLAARIKLMLTRLLNCDSHIRLLYVHCCRCISRQDDVFYADMMRNGNEHTCTSQQHVCRMLTWSRCIRAQFNSINLIQYANGAEFETHDRHWNARKRSSIMWPIVCFIVINFQKVHSVWEKADVFLKSSSPD